MTVQRSDLPTSPQTSNIFLETRRDDKTSAVFLGGSDMRCQSVISRDLSPVIQGAVFSTSRPAPSVMLSDAIVLKSHLASILGAR